MWDGKAKYGKDSTSAFTGDFLGDLGPHTDSTPLGPSLLLRHVDTKDVPRDTSSSEEPWSSETGGERAPEETPPFPVPSSKDIPSSVPCFSPFW